MDKVTTAERLQQLMDERGLKQADILEMCKPFAEKHGVKLGRSGLSQYVSGKVLPKQTMLTVLGEALNVSEVWLMGYDIPRERILYTKNDQILDIVEKLKSDTVYYSLCVALAELSDDKLKAIFAAIFR